MNKLLFNENLYEINDTVVNIINFCKKNSSRKKVMDLFNNVKELNELIESEVLIINNNTINIANNVKISESSDVLVAISYCFGFQCNFDCKHCYSRILFRDKRNIMNEKQAEYITKAIIQARPMNVRLGGGEPLMRKDFFTTMKALSKAEICVSFTTNGWYMTQEMAEQLSLLKNLEPARLSIHGIGKSHDNFTGVTGSFNRLMKAQEILKKNKLEYEFIVVLNIHTQDKIKDFIELAEKKGAKKIQFRAMTISGKATIEQALSLEEYHKTYIFVQNEKKHHKTEIDFATNTFVAKYLKIEEKCFCGIHQLTINPSGDVSSCGLNFKPIGNVFKEKIVNIWKKNLDVLYKGNEKGCPCEIAERQRAG